MQRQLPLANWLKSRLQAKGVTNARYSFNHSLDFVFNRRASHMALCVEVGSWHDPKEYPGMAHFLEHMLFMGNEAYPDESEYMRYIADHAGQVNAYTASDRTVYMFSVSNPSFLGALDRFSHFFIDPLFSLSSINRELHAVDQEHAKNLEHDGWRQYMIFKETGNPDHPNAKFSTGNANTLKNIPQKALKEWYYKHYSADRMHLVVLSSLPLDELKEVTVKSFASVSQHDAPLESIQGQMTSQKQWGQLLYIKPVKDLKTLNLSWELPAELAKNQDSKIHKLIGYVLSSDAPHTLKSRLKKAGLIEGLTASEDVFSKQHKLFSIDLTLTDEGLESLPLITQHCLSSLEQLKKTAIPFYIFEEIQTIAGLSYKYQSREDAFLFVKETADALATEPLSTYPLKTLMPTVYDPELIQTYLNQLTAEKCLYTVLADPEKSKVPPKCKEKWMGAEYAFVPITSKELASWKLAATELTENELPPPNPYLPTALLEQQEKPQIAKAAKVVPDLLAETERARLYFAEDHYYGVPEIAHGFRLYSPLIDGTARSKVLLDLYLKSLEENLRFSLSMAEYAGLSTHISHERLYFTIELSGYVPKSAQLTQEIFQNLKKVKPSREEFALYCASLRSGYANSSKELPCVQSHELLSSILFNCCPQSGEKLSTLASISYEEFLSFSSKLFEKSYVEGLLYGALSKESALELWQTVEKELSPVAYPPSAQLRRKVLLLPESSGPFMVMQKTAMQGHSALLLIEEGPYTLEKRACQLLLSSALKEEFFDTLRTKQQTAYIARSWASEEEGHLLHYFMVQSSSHEPSHLLARFELFLESFLKQFSSRLSPERFENMRTILVHNLQMHPENLSAMKKRLFTLAFDKEGDFCLIEKGIEVLKKLSYEELKQFAEDSFSRSNMRRLAILNEGILPKEKVFHYEVTTSDLLRGEGVYLAWK